MVIEEQPYQIQLDLAKAKLEEAQAELVQAQQSKSREVAEAQLHLDEAQRTLDQVEERRERSLLARNAATIDDVDRRVATLKKSSAQVEADLAKLEQTRADYETNILAAKAKVNAAKADVEDAALNLGYCKMDAPIDGKIGQLLVKAGNLVGPDQNTDLVTIRQLNPMGVDLFPPALSAAADALDEERAVDEPLHRGAAGPSGRGQGLLHRQLGGVDHRDGPDEGDGPATRTSRCCPAST